MTQLSQADRGQSVARVRAGVGRSAAENPQVAGREAAAEALAALGDAEPALAMVYSAMRYDGAELLNGIRGVTGTTPLIGSTTSGHFAGGSYVPPGEGVAVLLMSAGPYRLGFAAAEHIRDDMNGVGQKLARESRADAGGGPHGAVLVLADGLVQDMCDHQQLIHGIYRVAGLRVPIVGGVASDEFTMSGTSVFYNDKVLEYGAVAVWISSDTPLHVVTGHGWTPVGRPMLVSVARGTQIIEIDGQSAFDAYTEQLATIGVRVDQHARFWDTGYRHPIGLLQPDGSVLIRVPEHKMDDDGSLWTHSPIPAGCAVQVMAASTDALLQAAGEVAQAAIARCPDAGTVLTFSCAARLAVCGPRIAEEATSLQAAAGVPTFGFYTYGEFARTVGTLGVHNATVTAIAL